ncbi:predicted protein [Lichtheimia corymbifera JMRC:FSU:9682]|uniref:Guanine nucleotide-binding protein-like 3 N-terminal domain-containing protein n=1 Tax=Lichtheimia corymbifera JMRC:FSU:9682 TaxID=1263082 RepID=A0A068S3F5_9FUNG|nr:predicted protein [Lichtheimia corymbifera JMRC:FSU:9682]
MVKKKPQSKRIKLARRYSIKRKIDNHNRKVRREARKNPKAANKPKKDPGIPNSFPFKEELLNQIELERQQKEEERLRNKAANQAEKRKRKKAAAKEAAKAAAGENTN